jgi:hypothetical protein
MRINMSIFFRKKEKVLGGFLSFDLAPLLAYGGGVIKGDLVVLGSLDPLDDFLKGLVPL